MTEAWATWTASLPRDSSRSERTAMTSLYSMRSPVSVQLRGPFLFELPQLRLDRLQLHAGAVPDLFVMGPSARGLHPHPPFGVLDRAPQALPFLRELLQFQADAMVPCSSVNSSPGPGFGTRARAGWSRAIQGYAPRHQPRTKKAAESPIKPPAMFGPTT